MTKKNKIRLFVYSFLLIGIIIIVGPKITKSIWDIHLQNRIDPGCRLDGCSGEICLNVSRPGRISACLGYPDWRCRNWFNRCVKNNDGICNWDDNIWYRTCARFYP